MKKKILVAAVFTAITANGTKLENTNNLDTAEFTMDGMQADSNGKLVRFSTHGIKAGNQVIEGVKAGVSDSDVVNVKQLKDSIANIGNLAVDTANIKLAYKADGNIAKTTSLKDGLNFTSGNFTTASVGDNGEVTYNVKISNLTVDGTGRVAGESGVATSDNVATVINRVVEQNTSDTKELKQAISNVSSETQRIGAHAAAMAALKPIQYDPLEPIQVMAGVTHKFGYSPEKKNIPDRYKGGPISSIYVMQDEMTRMQAKNDAQQVEIEQQRAEIESLKSMVQQLVGRH